MTTATLEYTPFAKVWEQADAIQGWLSRREGELLHRVAMETPERGFILEIGAYRGRSTSLLASTGREMVTIDPLVIGSPVSEHKTIAEEDVTALLSVVDSYENLNWARHAATHLDSSIFPEIDLLFIDGDHGEQSALKDFKHYRSRLKDGALVAFHDFGSEPAVTQSVKQLEREGVLRFREQAGSLWVGYHAAEPTKPEVEPIRVYVALPHSGHLEPESRQSAECGAYGYAGIKADVRSHCFSILPANFNDCVVTCLCADHYDYFALHHSDIQMPAGWLGSMIHTMESKHIDVLHAVSPIKGDTGETSTAVAYSGDRWQSPRKLTVYELHQLPELFDVNDCRRALVKGEGIERLLCNTGALVIRIGDWFKDFTGFANFDRIVRTGEKSWRRDTVPEDWNFGHWCADHGINVWATRTPTVGHWGRWKYTTDRIYGYKHAPKWAAANGVEQ